MKTKLMWQSGRRGQKHRGGQWNDSNRMDRGLIEALKQRESNAKKR